ncbi:tetratricopeptide repeat protein [Sphingomonas colocasiae]|uniref:Tetratricopeptide repeat protein n=1 Tax=Sphingomonas colocasiae TaxID=1848973 RepID=A0ABS7PYK9_9SPHN|nr:tetratricopeptide repeat protein [Sphingomonas colocasiae]MBY8825059.1 tetratricopeptide repeat protein [Sphingomonas colocasiae]
MAETDIHGLTLTTASQAAAAAYREGVALLLSAWPGAAEALDAAIALDPGFALAHAARARLHAIRAETAAARAGIATAARLAARGGTERERDHIGIIGHAIAGRSGAALAGALAHAERWPRDVIILGLPLGAFGLFAFSGAADHDQARVDLCERHARHFAADDWWMLTYRGWALAENGAVTRGRDMLERAFERRVENANGVHALTHALHEAGAGADAAALIADWLPRYDRAGILHGHIAWHAALVALERGDAGAALRIHADQVRPGASLGMPINIVSDTASLLWRLGAYGHAVPDGAWRDIAGYAAAAFPDAGHGFIDPHMAMIEAMAGDRAALDRRIAALDDMVARGAPGAGAVVPAIARAMRAFADGDHAETARLLEPVAGDVVRIGGSGAQREVVEDTLIVAWMRAGETEKARVTRPPTAPPPVAARPPLARSAWRMIAAARAMCDQPAHGGPLRAEFRFPQMPGGG